LAAANFDIEILKWFQKAIKRNDHFSFMKYKFEFIENFVATVFAINREWYSDEKRLIERMERLPILPPDTRNRLEHLIMHRGSCSNLKGSLENIKRLYKDLCRISSEKHPGIELPINERLKRV
jgi:hypothetical protein